MKRCNTSSGVSGFTLIEVSIGLALITLLLAVTLPFVIDGIRYYEDFSRRQDLRQQALIIGEQVYRAARSAREVSISDDGQMLVLKRPASSIVYKVGEGSLADTALTGFSLAEAGESSERDVVRFDLVMDKGRFVLPMAVYPRLSAIEIE